MIVSALTACSRNETVKEYFDSHGMNFPVDVVGISLLGINYAGIEQDELTEPGAREFVEEGLQFVRLDLRNQTPRVFMHGAAAIKADKVVLYRAESGEVGLMVRVTGYGQGNPSKELLSKIEWVGRKELFWKYENYAYYVRNELYMWEFGGWLF